MFCDLLLCQFDVRGCHRTSSCACAAYRQTIGDGMFHQGVARRSESSLNLRLSPGASWVNFFMTFNHSLSAAQGPAMPWKVRRL
jgi:hypothetical protein